MLMVRAGQFKRFSSRRRRANTCAISKKQKQLSAQSSGSEAPNSLFTHLSVGAAGNRPVGLLVNRVGIGLMLAVCAFLFACVRANAAQLVKEYIFLSPNLYGYIDKTGKQVIEPKFRRGEEFSEGVAAGFVGPKWGYIDHEGKLLGMPQFKYLPPLTDGLAPVQIENRFYYVDRTGTQVVTAPHEVFPWRLGDARRFSEGLAGVFVSHSAQQGAASTAPATAEADAWGYIDKLGKLVIDSKFVAVRPFSEGLAGVRLHNKWGYIDRTGKVVVAAQFDWGNPFSEGFAAVQKGPVWRFIDKNGKVLGKLEFAALGNFS